MGQIPYGMIGGGAGAMIGNVHRIAARMDGRFKLVAGVFSAEAAKSRAFGEAEGLDPARLYPDFETMAAAEAARPDGIRAVSIVTPNHMHAAPAIAFLAKGVHVICDKPLTATLAEAAALKEAAESAKSLFLLTHNYTAYPLVRQARAMIARGDLGRIRAIQVEYLQDWLATKAEAAGSKQALWRVDPAKSGMGGALGDIGTHGWNLAQFVTGLTPSAISADLTAFGEGRVLDDHANILMRYDSGARGSLLISQIAVGNENGLRLRVYGEKGGLEWAQENPNELWFTALGQARQRLTRNGPGSVAENIAASRVPSGHPEGYLEAFANLYREAADLIEAHAAGRDIPRLVPSLSDGLSGMDFIAAAVQSSRQDGQWVSL